jgi:hypothetical protein
MEIQSKLPQVSNEIRSLKYVEEEPKVNEGLFTALWRENRENIFVYPHLKTKRGSTTKGFEITLTGKKEDYHLVDLDQFIKYIAEGRFDEIGRVRMKPRDGGQSNGFSVKTSLMSDDLKMKIEKLRQEI